MAKSLQSKPKLAVPANESGARPTMRNPSGSREIDYSGIEEPSVNVEGPIERRASEPSDRAEGKREAVVQEAPTPGMVIAQKYELCHCLGQGGMGTVWRARDCALDIDVALKLLRPELVAPVLAQRLSVEARSAAKLQHPAIVRIHDLGVADGGAPFLVMELLEGEVLSDRIRRMGWLEPEDALRLLLPIAHGLEAAHRNSVVHRDLKPENVLFAELDSGVQPKLLDFGVAKMDRPGQDRLTAAGVAVGSPSYMSPEQAKGLEADARSDIWAFCVVLYEVLTGVLPFTHPNHNGLMQRIINFDPEPLSSHGVRVPGLWPIIERGLSKSVERRWQTMRELGRELAMWLLARGVTEDITGRSLRSAWLEGDPWASNAVVPSEVPQLEVVQSPTLQGSRVSRQRPQHQWLRYAVLPALMALVGGSAGWYFRTRAPEPLAVARTVELRTGVARALSDRLPMWSAPTEPTHGNATLSQAASLPENHATPESGQAYAVTNVKSANPGASEAPRAPAKATPGVGHLGSASYSKGSAVPSQAVPTPGSKLDIKTDF